MFDDYDFDDLTQKQKDDMLNTLNRTCTNMCIYDVFDIVDNGDFDDFIYGNSQFTTSDGADCYDVLDKAVDDCKYDNGVGLNEKAWYFDHYDRDQDYNEFFSNDEIISYDWNDDGKLLLILSYTAKKLRSDVMGDLDGSSYEHDFGKKW